MLPWEPDAAAVVIGWVLNPDEWWPPFSEEFC